MDRLDAIRVFVRVVESGSFSAVARELGVGQPTVSKQIAALERYLGAQLLMRTSHAVKLTDAGRDFFESSSRQSPAVFWVSDSAPKSFTPKREIRREIWSRIGPIRTTIPSRTRSYGKRCKPLQGLTPNSSKQPRKLALTRFVG